MTRPRLHPNPSADVVAKTGRIVDAHDTGQRPIIIDPITDPRTGAWSGMVPSETQPGVAYHVTHGELLGWQCACRSTTFCSHIGAAAVLAERAGFNQKDLP